MNRLYRSYHGRFSCYKSQNHYYQMRGKGQYYVYVIATDDSYDIYYQKPNYPIIYAFSITCTDTPLDIAFEIAWANTIKYDEILFN